MTGPFPPDPSSPRPAASSATARLDSWARGSTLLVTFLTKIAGVVLAVNELLFRANWRPPAVGLAAFMIAGAQVSEGVVLGMIDRFMDRAPQK